MTIAYGSVYLLLTILSARIGCGGKITYWDTGMTRDVDWIVDVVNDLEKFCKFNNLIVSAKELGHVSMTLKSEALAFGKLPSSAEASITPVQARRRE